MNPDYRLFRVSLEFYNDDGDVFDFMDLVWARDRNEAVHKTSEQLVDYYEIEADPSDRDRLVSEIAGKTRSEQVVDVVDELRSTVKILFRPHWNQNKSDRRTHLTLMSSLLQAIGALPSGHPPPIRTKFRSSLE